jgi:hypothetical protein
VFRETGETWQSIPPIAFINQRLNRPGLAADGAFFAPLDSRCLDEVYRHCDVIKITLNLLPDYIIRLLSGQQNSCLTRSVRDMSNHCINIICINTSVSRFA